MQKVEALELKAQQRRCGVNGKPAGISAIPHGLVQKWWGAQKLVGFPANNDYMINIG